MRDMIRTLRHFGLYLLPASLIATAGVLSMALLRPIPSAVPSDAFHATEVVDQNEYWRSHAEILFAVMMAEALRQQREERGNSHAQTLEYRYERFLPFEERSTLPPASDGGGTSRLLLIRL